MWTKLHTALASDQVLSAAQVAALCGRLPTSDELVRERLSSLRIVLETVSGSPTSHVSTRVYSTMSERRLRAVQEWRLGHLAGAAQVKFLLARPDEQTTRTLELAGARWSLEERRALLDDSTPWQSEAAAVGQSERPDAVWHSSLGEVAIEYDTGSYRPDVIARKLRAFSAYSGGLIWAVSSPTREVTLRRRLPRDVPVLLARWW